MILTEKTKQKLYKLLINEGVETKNMKAAKHYLYEKLGYSEQQAMQCIGKIKTDIPNSKLGKCKFMLAMVRMFQEGEFNEGQIIMNVNKSLKYAASDAHINEYDQNLNGLTAEQFIQRFATIAQNALEQDKKDVSSLQYDEQNSQYQIVKINSYEEAEEYAWYVDWCVTHDVEMYNSYTNCGECIFYFCLRDDYEDIEEIQGENCPLDDYGLSMIAVSIHPDGSCNTITCRWNHSNGGNDSIMTPKQLSQIINRNFYQTFKPLTPEEIKQNFQNKLYQIKEEIEEQLEYNNDLEDICEIYACDEDEGNTDNRKIYVYKSDSGGSVVLDEEGNLLIEEIFSYVGIRRGDILTVEKGNKSNFINIDGKYISDTWFDDVDNEFDWGFSRVIKGKKMNIIDKNGQPIIPEWVQCITDSYYNSLQGTGIVEVINGKNINFFNINTRKYIFQNPIQDFHSFRYGDNMFIGDDGYMHYEANTLYFIKFINQDFYQLFELKTGQLIAPFKFEQIYLNSHNEAQVKFAGNEQAYIIKENGDLYTKTRVKNGGYNYQLIQKNPFNQQTNENKQKRKIICITKRQEKLLKENLNQKFSTNFLKNNKWKNGTELINYCENCNLLCIGEGASRKVFQIDDEHIIKIEKDKRFGTEQQNTQEINAFNQCDEQMKNFVPLIFDYDKNNKQPMWIIAEQVLPASYTDFQKILGIDFGSYTSSADITQMKQELKDYSKYKGKQTTKFSLNLMDFLEAYGENDIELYFNQIKTNPWLKELYTLLQNNIVCYWELEKIDNWGLVKRNGQPKLIILDIGI